MSSLSLKGRDCVAVLDFDRSELEEVFEVADRMRSYTKSGTDLLKNKVLCTLFFEPSTRTRLSFETAMLRLGGSVIGFADPSSSRVVTGETLADTVRMADYYSNVIVLRHRIEGSARLAAEIAEAPVINAGDGSQHHPTQTLTDLYTIRREFGRIDGLRIAILGDLRQARSASSLAYGLSLYRDIELYLVSPSALRLRPEVVDHMHRSGLKVTETSDVSQIISQLDVLYVTRLQKERFSDPSEYDRLKGSYILSTQMLEKAGKQMIIMHHLPRIEEIPLEIDDTRHARYFQQAANGVPIRMALLSLLVS